MKSWIDIIRENAICIGGHKDHVSAYLCHMLYCIETSTPHNLVFFILIRTEMTCFKPKDLLPYGMLLTRLFKHVVSVSPELAFDHYLSYDRAIHPLASHYERKRRADRGNKRPRESNSSSSSCTLNHPSLSYPLDDSIDENDDESFHSNPSSSFQNISSLSNDVSRVHQNPPHKSHYLNTFLSKTINLQTQQRDAHWEGLRTGGWTGRGSRRTRGRTGNQSNGGIDEQGGQGNQGNNQGNNRNQNDDAVNDNIQVYTHWIEKMESIQDMSGCRDDQKTLTLMREEFCPINEMQKLETKFWNHAMVGDGHAAYTDRFQELARPLGAYDLGVATLRALVYAGVMTSEDTRSWCMISGDAKS
uniref:Reverse transcriptase domain-containing protein n=1 Tax=Tanacetum cinerariifolium TaxID=118510 RepID=A0A6L2N714_TANCI|nr:hypothetical protein [Tanacetum cinerariifolium]